MELSETCASLPFTLCTTWLRFMASSPERWLPKCFTSLEPLVVTLPAIVEESHWLLDSVGACSTLTGCRSWVAAWRGPQTTGGSRCLGPSSLLGEPLNPCTRDPSSLEDSSSCSCLRETSTALLISCLKKVENQETGNWKLETGFEETHCESSGLESVSGPKLVISLLSPEQDSLSFHQQHWI